VYHNELGGLKLCQSRGGFSGGSTFNMLWVGLRVLW
jgi:hypothetical protein